MSVESADMTRLVKEYEEKKQKFFEKSTVQDFQKAIVSKAKPSVEVSIVVQKLSVGDSRVLKDIELLTSEVYEDNQSHLRQFVSFHATHNA